MALINNEKEVCDTLRQIVGYDDVRGMLFNGKLSTIWDELINNGSSEQLKSLSESDHALKNLFEMAGLMTIWTYTDHAGHMFSYTKFADMLLAKHKAYGDQAIRKWWPAGVILRIDAKIERYKTISSGKSGENDEPLRDTLRDIVGYCVLGLRLLKEKQDVGC